MLDKQGGSMTKYGQGEVLSRPSNSRLAEVYKSEEFRNEWANDIPFHIARNVLYLRRYRKMSQAEVAAAMGTSQSAIARIETAQENITIETLQRLITALKGRCYLSIHPEGYLIHHQRPWWERIEDPVATGTPWNLVCLATRRSTHTDQVVIGLERTRQTTGDKAQLFLESKAS